MERPDDAAQVDTAICTFAQHLPKLPLAVAYSGGADSTALLVACAERWPGQVRAWHIHHGLQPAADGFVQHCTERCAALGLPLTVKRIDARARRGESPENAARTLRYAAFDQLAASQNIRTVVLAQHADDQVETVLLALSRGSGLPGLAAMPMHWTRARTDYWRPLLRVPQTAIRTWLRTRNVDWIEDPTNTDQRYTRNRIRARLLPMLEQIFPTFRTTFARSAEHAAEAQELLTEVATQDLAGCGDPPRIDALRQLSRARRGNALRFWLHRDHGQTPSRAQLDELQSQIEACRTRGHRIELKVAGGRIQRVESVLRWTADREPSSASPLK